MKTKDPKARFGFESSEQSVNEYREIIASKIAETKVERDWIQTGDFDFDRQLPECKFEFNVLRSGEIASE